MPTIYESDHDIYTSIKEVLRVDWRIREQQEAARRQIWAGRMPWNTRIRRLEELQEKVGDPVTLWIPKRGTRGAK